MLNNESLFSQNKHQLLLDALKNCSIKDALVFVVLKRILLHCEVDDSKVVEDFPFKRRHVRCSLQTANSLRDKKEIEF